jgi:exodeoxyribonuclease VII small subunit
MARVEEIVNMLDRGEVGLRETLGLIQEAAGLIAFCRDELNAVSGALEEIRLPQLMQSLGIPERAI